MKRQPYRALPQRVWLAFLGFTFVSIVVGAFYGSGRIPGVGLALGVFCILAAFVPWAVLQLDPRGLAELGIYNREQDEDQNAGRDS